uniref:Uncharacterized protein n=1 Tax=Leersia perrieri TaxID=77586 RepID=A0A0D9WPI9_9ORYZ
MDQYLHFWNILLVLGIKTLQSRLPRRRKFFIPKCLGSCLHLQALKTLLIPLMVNIKQQTLRQLIAMYIGLQKQRSTFVSAPIAKEGKRIETSLGRNMEKSIKANIDDMWTHFQEENANHEEAKRERMLSNHNFCKQGYSCYAGELTKERNIFYRREIAIFCLFWFTPGCSNCFI